jgi:uncharacterized LabA/DUF88 family protein
MFKFLPLLLDCIGKKIVIMVDGSNLYMSAKRFGTKIWPPDLPEMLVGQIKGDINPVHSVHYFTSRDKHNANQQRFINAISKCGIMVHEYELRVYQNAEVCHDCDKICASCGRDLRVKPHKEKMLDIAIATTMIELAYQRDAASFDTFVLVSGDKDLIPAIRLLRRKLGKEVIIAGFRHKDLAKNSLAFEMDREVDQVINLTKFVEG